MVILEGLLGPGVSEFASTEVIVLCDQPEQLRALHLDWGQLVLVVLAEGAARPVLEQSVVIEEDTDIIEHFIEFSGWGMEDEVSCNPNLLGIR